MYDDLKKLKFGIYARKSTESEERQVQSIEDQVKVMRRIADEFGLTVVEEAVLSEAKSAKIPDQRPVFDEFIKLIENGTINGVLSWKSNRLARNPKESGAIQQLLIDDKIGAIVTDGKVYLPEDNAIIFSVDTSMDTQFSRDLVKVVRRGMATKAEKGWLPCAPPIGYKNDVINKTIVKDPKRYRLVREMWDMLLSGAFTVREISYKAEYEWGLTTMKRKKRGGKPLSYSGVYCMFHNPFYKGWFNYDGKPYKGRHPAMVTEEEFDRVQYKLSNEHAARPKQEEYAFIFRGLLLCGECGCSITPQHSVKKQKNGVVRDYYYYRCTLKRRHYKCSQTKHKTEKDLGQQIKDRLEKVTISPRFYELAVLALQERNEDKIFKQLKISDTQHKSITAKEIEITNLGRMRYRGECPDDAFYASESKKLENELKALKKARDKAEKAAKQWRSIADETFSFARYAKEDYDSDSLENKRRVLVRMGQNLTLMDGKIQFTDMKYFEPIEKQYPALVARMEKVRNSPEQIRNKVEQEVISMWCG